MQDIPIVRDCMHEVTITLSPEMDIIEAVKLLLRRECPGAPVIDQESQVIGILTEKDCLRVLSNDAVYGLKGGTVGDYMSPMHTHLHPDMDLFGAANRFLSTNFASLPVVVDGKLIGCVTRIGMLKGILELERRVVTNEETQRRNQRILNDPSDKGSMQHLVASERPEPLAEVLRHRHDRT